MRRSSRHVASEALERRTLLSAGYLDQAFGSGGRLLDQQAIDFGPADDVVIQHDGKVLLCTTDSGEGDFHLRRFLTNGKLDTTFGAGGTLRIGFGLDATKPVHLAVQADDRIVVGGVAKSDFAFIRLNTDGSPDKTFSGDGVATLSTGTLGPATVRDLVVQADGRILAAGSCDGHLGLARVNANGTADTTFGTGGVDRVNATGLGEGINRIALRSDGRIVASGWRAGTSGANRYFVLFGLTARGALDASFGTGGVAKPPSSFVSIVVDSERDFGRTDPPSTALAIAPDGKIVAGFDKGFVNSEYLDGYFDAYVMRFNTNGSIDASFNAGKQVHLGGFRQTDFSRLNFGVSDIAVAKNGDIYIAGADAVVRIKSSGAIDKSYGDPDPTQASDPGEHVRLYPYQTAIRSMQLLADGSVVVAADSQIYLSATSVSTGQETRIGGAIKLTPAGKRDAAFGLGGRIGTDLAGRIGSYSNVVSLSDGRFLTVGSGLSLSGGSQDFVVERHLASGSLDTSFGIGGRATIDVAGRNDSASAAVLQSDGKIIIVGGSEPVARGDLSDSIFFGTSDFAVARLNANGTLDRTFAQNGIFRYADPFAQGVSFAQAFALAVMPDNSIFFGGEVGSTYQPGGELFHLTANGQLDQKFSGVGGQSFSTPVASILPISGGRIVVVTESELVRLNGDGSIDKTFGVGGTARLATGMTIVYSGALAADGKIVLAGGGTTARDGRDFAVFRYNANGTVDQTFGKSGIPGVATLPASLAGEPNPAGNLVLQSDGKIIALGQPFAARFNGDGSIDGSFGAGGIVTPSFAFGLRNFATAGAITPSGKLIIVGQENRPVAEALAPVAAQFHLDDFARVSSTGTLRITGTAGADSIALSRKGAQLIVRFNELTQTFAWDKIQRVQIDAGAGNDVLTDRIVRPVTLTGGDGNDSLLAESSGGTLMDGGAGNDKLVGGPVADILRGGDGFDTVDYSSRTIGVTITVGDGQANDGAAGEGDNVENDIEQVLGGSGNDRITARAMGDVLIGAAGNDTLIGGAGIDALHGGSGTDQLFGNAANDFLDGGLGKDTLDGGPGNDKAAHDPTDLLISIEAP